MISPKDVAIIDKDKVPAGKLVGVYTFLRDMGKALEKGRALQVVPVDAAEGKKIQNRWRAYFKGEAHSRKEVQPDGKIVLYLWKD